MKKLRNTLFAVKERLLLIHVDVVIAAFPKTGSTWLQTMIRKMLAEHCNLGDEEIPHLFVGSLGRLHKVPPGIPHIYVTHNMPNFNEESYEFMTVDNAKFRGKKVILLVREPKDTLVSLYFHNRYRTVPPVYNDDINAMVHDDVYGIGKYIKFYQSWVDDSRLCKGFLLVRYEDLRADPELSLRGICEFIGLEGVSEDTIRRVVAFSSFENMRKYEEKNSRHLPGLNRSENLLPEAFKVRDGTVGGYKKHLSQESIQFIDQCIEEGLPPMYGYPWRPEA